MKKSGRKKVFDQRAEGLNTPLDREGFAASRGLHPELTPGVAGLNDPVKPRQRHRLELVLRQRRRRQLASRQKVS
jgi:hypothetical protein